MNDKIEAVFLGLDPAKHTSGASILAPDYGGMDEPEHAFDGNYFLHEFGKVVSQSERERFVSSALDMAAEAKLPLIVVAEVWDPPRDRKIRLPGGEFAYARDPKWTYETILGIGEGWGRWSAEIESANEYLVEQGLPKIIVLRRTPNDWRDTLFGPRRPRDTAALKALAQRYFKAVFGYDASPDVAEAGCIALVGTTAPEAAAAAQAWREPRRRRRKRAS